MRARADFFGRAPRIEGASLVSAGSVGPAARVGMGQAARDGLADGPMEISDGAGHYGCMENRAAFNTILSDFIAAT